MVVAASGPEAREVIASIRVTQLTKDTQTYGRTGGMRMAPIKGVGAWPARRTYSLRLPPALALVPIS